MDIKINNILYTKVVYIEIDLVPYEYQKGLTIYIEDNYKIKLRQNLEEETITRVKTYEQRPTIEFI